MNKEVLIGLKKKNAAGMVYEYLRHTLHEEDLTDLLPALTLRDIYDCRVCAHACMQVYCKGIMDGDSEVVFGMETLLTESQAEEIVLRIQNPERRRKPTPCESPATFRPLEEALALTDSGYLWLVDVRTADAYEKGHPAGAIHIPLAKILENPAIVPGNRSVTFYCEEGHLSLVAANCLSDHGYARVSYTKLPKT